MKALRVFCIVALVLLGAPAALAEPNPYDGPVMPKFDFSTDTTPMRIVHEMLKIAKVGPGDVLIDLGCGDGRIPITAATAYGAKASGVDLNPDILVEARKNAMRAGVEDKVQFLEQDVFKADIAPATVVTAVIWPNIHVKLRPMLLEKLAPGSRVVTNLYGMGDWKADKLVRIGADTKHGWHVYPIYLWIVPARVDGAWTMQAGDRRIGLKIDRKYQFFRGSGTVDGRAQPIRNGRIEGTRLTFELAITGRTRRFAGRLQADGSISGEGWSARRN
jgi:precorrin-6B methylase 2